MDTAVCSIRYGNFVCAVCNKSYRRNDAYNLHVIKCNQVNQSIKEHGVKCDANDKLVSYDGDPIDNRKEITPICDLLSGYRVKDMQLYDTEKSEDTRIVVKKRPRKGVSGYMKRFVAARQEWRCNVCDCILPASFQVDHIKQRSKGGSNEHTNLQALCPNCHADKTWLEGISLCDQHVINGIN